MEIQNINSSHLSIILSLLNQNRDRTGASKNLFKAAAAFYLHQMHLQIMESWKKFAETERAIAKENRATHRARERRKSEENAQRAGQQKVAEARNESPTEKILL